jgi:hypothetical protein
LIRDHPGSCGDAGLACDRSHRHAKGFDGLALRVQQVLRQPQRAATIYSLTETAKLNGIDDEAYLRDVLARIADHLINRIRDLLAFNWTSGAANLVA